MKEEIPNQGMRLTDKLFEYWKKARGDRSFPALEDIDRTELKDVWDNSFII